MSTEFRQRVDAICKHLPGSEKSDPWGGGHDAWKVGGKMYACIGSVEKGVSVKCADIETASLIIEQGGAVRAPYFHKSWVKLEEDVPDPDLKFRVETSYDLVRSKLPAKIRNALPARSAVGGV